MDFAADDGGDEHAHADLVDGDGAADDHAGIGLADGAAVEGGDTHGRAGDIDLFGGHAADRAPLYGEGRLGEIGVCGVVPVAAGGVERHGGTVNRAA